MIVNQQTAYSEHYFPAITTDFIPDTGQTRVIGPEPNTKCVEVAIDATFVALAPYFLGLLIDRDKMEASDQSHTDGFGWMRDVVVA